MNSWAAVLLVVGGVHLGMLLVAVCVPGKGSNEVQEPAPAPPMGLVVCQAAQDCPAAAPVCGERLCACTLQVEPRGVCVGYCGADIDCNHPYKHCDALQGRCVWGCFEDAQCSRPGEYCGAWGRCGVREIAP